MTTFVSFSKKELFSIIKSCNNLLIPRLEKLFQRHFKKIAKDKECTNKLIDIANACINLGHWPTHFKILSTVIIPKPNKISYDLPKLFRPIVLLNTTSKLFEKMIGERLQFSSISNNFIHPCQLGGFKYRSTSDTDITLTHFIRSEQIKNLIMSMLAFNITQFFSSLNHQLIMAKANFDSKVFNFFKNYLVGRKTKYLWNSLSFPYYNVDVGVSQGSALFPILSALYLFPIFYILENHLKT